MVKLQIVFHGNQLIPIFTASNPDKTPQPMILYFSGSGNNLAIACLHFCPHQAMELNHKPTLKEQQYHHPDIQLKDMMTSRP